MDCLCRLGQQRKTGRGVREGGAGVGGGGGGGAPVRDLGVFTIISLTDILCPLSISVLSATLVAAVVGCVLSAAVFFTLTLLVWRFCRRKRSVTGSYEKIVSDHRLQQVAVEKGSNIPATAVRQVPPVLLPACLTHSHVTCRRELVRVLFSSVSFLFRSQCF